MIGNRFIGNQSDHQKTLESANGGLDANQIPLGSSIEGSQIKRRLNRNTINLAKLSLVLKNKSKLNVSKNDTPGGRGSSQHMPEHLQKIKREEINSLANILNETLSKLKKPNTHFL